MFFVLAVFVTPTMSYFVSELLAALSEMAQKKTKKVQISVPPFLLNSGVYACTRKSFWT